MRETLLLNAISLLQRNGFFVESFYDSNACFDLVAKSPEARLIVKVFSNIDALREEQALELKRLSNLFKYDALILGEKSKAFNLEKGIVYERYGLPAISIESFKDLLNECFPSIKYFKGKELVELDSGKLHKKREQLKLSLNDLAEKLRVSKESIFRYEKGKGIELKTAQKLEKILKTDLIKQSNSFNEFFSSFEKPEKISLSHEFNDKALEKLNDLGLRLELFEHASFKAFGNPQDSLLINVGEQKMELEKKALALEKSRVVFGSPHSVLLSKKFGAKKISSTPIIQETELDSFSSGKDFLKELKKREK